MPNYGRSLELPDIIRTLNAYNPLSCEAAALPCYPCQEVFEYMFHYLEGSE